MPGIDKSILDKIFKAIENRPNSRIVIESDGKIYIEKQFGSGHIHRNLQGFYYSVAKEIEVDQNDLFRTSSLAQNNSVTGIRSFSEFGLKTQRRNPNSTKYNAVRLENIFSDVRKADKVIGVHNSEEEFKENVKKATRKGE